MAWDPHDYEAPRLLLLLLLLLCEAFRDTDYALTLSGRGLIKLKTSPRSKFMVHPPQSILKPHGNRSLHLTLARISIEASTLQPSLIHSLGDANVPDG